jgi:hypothetical protein
MCHKIDAAIQLIACAYKVNFGKERMAPDQDYCMGGSHVELLGNQASPLMVADCVTGDAPSIAGTAAELAPFPPARGNAYPGLRRFIRPNDTQAADYARALLQKLAPAINAAFNLNGFDLLSASFSIVTTRPETLSTIQRAPHFDSTDPLHLAVLHYVGGTHGSGTAFYRQCSTGIERVTDSNCSTFVTAAQREAADWYGYIGESNRSFERIGAIAAVRDRVIVYQGSLLHSGMIPDNLSFSADPSIGRLTTNLFLRGRARAAPR